MSLVIPFGFLRSQAGPAGTPFFDALNSVFGSNLVRLYKLHETSETTAADATGNADGTYIGGPTLGQTAMSKDSGAASVLLDGSDDLVQQAASGLFNGLQGLPVTLFCLVRSTTPQTLRPIVSWSRLVSSGRSHVIGVDNAGKITMYTFNSDNGVVHYWLSSDRNIHDGEMRLLVATWASTTDRRLYENDGVLIASSTDTVLYGTSGTDRVFDVGRHRTAQSNPFVDAGPTPRCFSGQVEYAGYAKQTVTQANVQALWAALQ